MLHVEFYTKYLTIIITGGEMLIVEFYNKFTNEFVQRYKTTAESPYYFLKALQIYITEYNEIARKQLIESKYKYLLDKFNKSE